MNMYIVPLTTEPNNTFVCSIPIDGQNRRLSFMFRYNSIAKYWTMRVSDPNERRVLIDSLPVLIGRYPSANLLEQHVHLGIGSATVVQIGPPTESENPDDTTLGTNFYLMWGDTIA